MGAESLGFAFLGAGFLEMDLVIVFRTCGLGATTILVTVGAVSMLGLLVLRVMDASRLGGNGMGVSFAVVRVL